MKTDKEYYLSLRQAMKATTTSLSTLSNRSSRCFSLEQDALHRLQHCRVADELTFGFVFVRPIAVFIFESETTQQDAYITTMLTVSLLTAFGRRRSCRWPPDTPRQSSLGHAETDRPWLDRGR